MICFISPQFFEIDTKKTLVVSQWTSCLDFVSKYLSQEGIPHVKYAIVIGFIRFPFHSLIRYQGDMNRVKREQAVKVFMSKEKARVMLMSLKCGGMCVDLLVKPTENYLGIGLNLTRANNVISLDLGWSFATESQAFDRVHRMGQTRNVLVQRIVIADTVEDRILQMQERKVWYTLSIWFSTVISLFPENLCRRNIRRRFLKEDG